MDYTATDVLLTPAPVRQVEALLRRRCAWYRSMSTRDLAMQHIRAARGENLSAGEQAVYSWAGGNATRFVNLSWQRS